MGSEENLGFLALTAGIVSAFVGKNAIRASELPELIASVHSALARTGQLAPASEPAPAVTPAVSIKKSVSDKYLICLEDGKRFKSLKRHLQSAHDMTPDDYRAKRGLPRDYPMVAPSYAASRSALAKASGLGASRRKELLLTDVEAPAPANDPTELSPPMRGAGEPKEAA